MLQNSVLCVIFCHIMSVSTKSLSISGYFKMIHHNSILRRRINKVTKSKPIVTISRYLYISATANLNETIKDYIHKGNINYARYIFDINKISRDASSWNIVISGHIKHGQTQHARELFDEMPHRNVVSYNAMLSGLNRAKNPEEIYCLFVDMRRKGFMPNQVTVSIFISAILNTTFNCLIPTLHCLVTVLGLNSSYFVGSGLIKGYSDLRDCNGMRKVFDEVLVKNVSSWNALISGFMDLQLTAEAKSAFHLMPEKNVITWTILVNGLVKNKKIDEARLVFDQNNERCVVLWTTMLSGYVQNGRFLQALNFFLKMLKSGTRPNQFTYSSALDACAGCSSLTLGKQIHSNILTFGTPLDVILLTSLVDMYAKCGEVKSSCYIFKNMPNKNLVTWNAIVGGYAMNGLAFRALDEFERMKKVGFSPDGTTFVNVLSACAHCGLVKEGEKLFKSMVEEYRIQPDLDHYACMVDMYGRKGYLDKAVEVIEEMPIEPDVVVWGALISACGLHSDLELSEFAREGINKLEKNHPAEYSMLSRIYSEKGKWSNVFELKMMMKERWAKKQKAGSWIESCMGGTR